jgi:hypothetical protein
MQLPKCRVFEKCKVLQKFRVPVLLATLTFIPLSGSATATKAVEQTAPMVVSYYNRGALDSRNFYKFDLIKAALEITRPDYGDYIIKPFVNEPTPKRQAQLIRSGTQLNLLWASPGTIISQSDVIPIPFDILQGLLGYRICLINKDAPLDISALTDAASLTQLSIGQGHWTDVKIYQNNQLQPRLAPSFEALFDMLKAKRFQCLPLGTNEVVMIYDEKKAQYPSLALDSQLLIHYEFPIYFYISDKHPRLAERMALGLKKLRESGEFDELFMRYHAQALARLNLAKRKMICLRSPYSDKPDQCTQPPQLPQLPAVHRQAHLQHSQ